MTRLERLRQLRFEGVQVFGARYLAIFTDSKTGTTFCVEPGATLGSALDAVIARFAATRRTA